MTGVERLHLEETLEDSPQTRNLLGVFEKDAHMLKNYIYHLNKCCARIITAQREMTAATQSLSAHLKTYDQQRFPLETDGSILSATLGHFSQYLDDLSTVHQIFSTQMSDGMMYPMSKFIQADLDEITTVGEMYKISTNDFEESIAKYMKLSKKKDVEKVRQDVSEDVYQMRKKYHQTAMHYYSSLNALQYKRKTAVLEPLVGLMQGQKAFYEMGHEATDKKELDDFLATTTASIQGVKLELNEETKKTVELIDAIEQNSSLLYHVEPSPELPYIPPNPTLNQKGGYLFVRNKQNILNTKWERCYFFIQGGNLMSQAKDAFAGSLVLDLNEEGVLAEALECDDRRHVFHVVHPRAKKSIILQTENEVEKEEWVATLNNAARESGYVKGKGEGFTPQRNLTVNVPPSKLARPQQMARSGPPPTPPSSPNDSSSNHIMFDAPIQFDIITPNSDDSRNSQAVKDGPPRRINPFDTSGSHDIVGHNLAAEDSTFVQNFIVRFLGSMEVKTDRGEQLILETMRQIMAARAIHNVFKTTESHLVVYSSTMRLLDPSNNSVRTQFLLEDLSFWAAHNENKRLFGLIARTKPIAAKDKNSFTCYVFECNINADEICHAISTATKLAYQALMQEKMKEQKKKETNILLANIGQLDDIDDEDDDDDENIDDILNYVKLEEELSASGTPISRLLNDEGKLRLVLEQDESIEQDGGDDGNPVQKEKVIKSLKDKEEEVDSESEA